EGGGDGGGGRGGEPPLRRQLQVVGRLGQRHRVARERDRDRRRQLDPLSVLGGEEHGQERVVWAFERERPVVTARLEVACTGRDLGEVVVERPVHFHAEIVGRSKNAGERRDRRQYAAIHAGRAEATKLRGH